MTISTSDRLAAVHARALDEFDDVQAAVYEVRRQCLEARRFVHVPGAQWEGQLGEQFENRPRLEFNMVQHAVNRVINEYRNNRITVDFTPKDGATNSDFADTCDGLYRADEQDSGAQEAYDNAFDEGVSGGFGALRLRAKYEDEDDDENEKQRVCIDPIFDADHCVYFDMGAKRQDKADAKRCWVLNFMTHGAYKEEYDEDPTTWPSDADRQFDWCTPDGVYVCEYYEIEEKSEIIHIFRGLDEQDMRVPQSELDADENKLNTLIATGFREVRQKKIKRKRVHKYILSGSKVLKDEGVIAGRCIPVIPFYGKRVFVDNVERCQGIAQPAMDAQRLQNSLLSWLTEIASRFDVEKPIFDPEQIRGHAAMWANDNVERYPYLLANALKDESGNKIPGSQVPMAYTKAPSIPPAMAALVQIAQQALTDLLGNQEAGEEMQPNLSGKAVELIQNRLDMQVFIYMSNFAKTIKRVGEVWLSMQKDILVEEERTMKTVSADGEVSSVVMNVPSYDEKTGEDTVDNDISAATFDVWIEVGPSSGTKKAATVRALTGMAAVSDDPQAKQVLQAAAIMNMEGEGIGELRDYFRKQLVRQGIYKPTDEEKEELAQEAAAKAGTPPDANTQYLLAAKDEAVTGATLNRAKTVDTLASANLKQAQAGKAAAETMGVHNDAQIASTEALHAMLTTPQPTTP